MSRRFGALRVADLPLTWKLLLPSLVLTLILSVAGTFVIVRHESNQSRDELDSLLAGNAVRVEVGLADELADLVESVRVVANVDGMAEAVRARNVDETARLTVQTFARSERIDLVATVVSDGAGLVVLRRGEGGIDREAGGDLRATAPVSRVLAAPAGDAPASSGVITDDDVSYLAVVAPVRAGSQLVGASVVGVRLGQLTTRIARQISAPVALYGTGREVLASSSTDAPRRIGLPPAGRTVRRYTKLDGDSVATLSGAFVLQGERAGAYATWLPREGRGSLWALGARIAGIFLVALIVVAGIGIVIARAVAKQIRELADTHEALASGNLDARVAVSGSDELGRLAAGLNTMAEQLHASHTELEQRVAARTEELQHLYEESVRAGEAKGEFFAAISHELRTPLFVILGHAELMSEPELQPDHKGWEKEYGEIIRDAAQDLLDRVNEILDLAKLETGNVELHTGEVALAGVARTVVGELRPLIRAAGVTLAVEVPDDLAPVRADEARLRDILRNLLSNAIKFTPAGGSVTVAATAKGRASIEVSVLDTGVGIPPDAQKHLFEPFYQVPGLQPVKHQASTGLGLAVAARLVEAHGGTLRVRSKVGEGSTFAFRLRAVRAPRRVARR